MRLVGVSKQNPMCNSRRRPLRHHHTPPYRRLNLGNKFGAVYFLFPRLNIRE